MIRRLLSTLWLTAISLLLAACSATLQPVAVPTQPVPATVQGRTEAPDPTLSAPAAIPRTDFEPTPGVITAGSTIQNGPFTFYLYLYNDAALNRNPVAPSLYSDLKGFGAYMFWKYSGPGMQGPVEEYWGTAPQLSLIETYPQLHADQTGGRSGGILLRGGFFIQGQSHTGDSVEVVIQMRTPGGVYGATISLVLAGSEGNFSPTSIQIR